MKALVLVLLAGMLPAVAFAAGIPATPLMTVYRFDGPLEVPFYDAARFARNGASSPAGTLTQGTSVNPCLVVRNGRPLTDRDGTPYVGFEVVIDAKRATPESAALFTEVARRRESMTVEDHQCAADTRYVIDVRNLAALGKPPRFDPPRPARTEPAPRPGSEIEAIVREFHASSDCEAANRRLVGRRDALRRAWDAFAAASRGRWPAGSLARARQLDFVMRTALYEGHLDRGCSAYGACERDVIVLSIRNRAVERCQRGQGCRDEGDFEGVASAVSQYNIWDELLTQTSGLTGCFLRPDLARDERYVRLQAMFEQNVADAERILFGGGSGVEAVFSGRPASDLARLRHYYHPPAMGKCFPNDPRLEYVTGAVAERDGRFALIAATRVRVGERRGSGYLFQKANVTDESNRDVIQVVDAYPGFVIDARKIELRPPGRCAPYGTPRGCNFPAIGRYRRTPSWLDAGEPLALTCRVPSRGESCRGEATAETVTVGGTCDVAMQPVAGVP